MLRAYVQQSSLILFTMLVLLLANPAARGQSLGEIARQNQQNKAAETSTANASKVITNADLPKDPDGNAEQSANEDQSPATPSQDARANRRAAQQRVAQEHAIAQWRQQILTQKNEIAVLQARIERLRAQIHFVDPNAYYDYNAGMMYSGPQARQMERLHDMESQLAAQKRRLEEMQEQARHAGMHTPVYDP